MGRSPRQQELLSCKVNLPPSMSATGSVQARNPQHHSGGLKRRGPLSFSELVPVLVAVKGKTTVLCWVKCVQGKLKGKPPFWGFPKKTHTHTHTHSHAHHLCGSLNTSILGPREIVTGSPCYQPVCPPKGPQFKLTQIQMGLYLNRNPFRALKSSQARNPQNGISTGFPLVSIGNDFPKQGLERHTQISLSSS